jgi:hypothetical protein
MLEKTKNCPGPDESRHRRQRLGGVPWLQREAKHAPGSMPGPPIPSPLFWDESSAVEGVCRPRTGRAKQTLSKKLCGHGGKVAKRLPSVCGCDVVVLPMLYMREHVGKDAVRGPLGPWLGRAARLGRPAAGGAAKRAPWKGSVSLEQAGRKICVRRLSPHFQQIR